MHPSETLPIKVAKSGFYDGFNRFVTLGAKALLALFILCVVLAPEKAGEILTLIQTDTVHIFSGWYMYVTFFFVLVCLGLALWPKSGRVRLGKSDDP